jgi:hypothetical protein
MDYTVLEKPYTLDELKKIVKEEVVKNNLAPRETALIKCVVPVEFDWITRQNFDLGDSYDSFNFTLCSQIFEGLDMLDEMEYRLVGCDVDKQELHVEVTGYVVELQFYE